MNLSVLKIPQVRSAKLAARWELKMKKIIIFMFLLTMVFSQNLKSPSIDLINQERVGNNYIVAIKFVNHYDTTIEFPLLSHTFILKIDKEPDFLGDTGTVTSNIEPNQKSITLKKNEEVTLKLKFKSDKIDSFKKNYPDHNYKLIYSINKIDENENKTKFLSYSSNTISFN